MNALGDRCHSVLVLVDTASTSSPVIDAACGYHVGCVLSSSNAETPPSADDIICDASYFFAENKVDYTAVDLSQDMADALLSSPVSAIEYCAKSVTLFNATRVTSVSSLPSLLSWLYGEDKNDAQASPSASSESPYTLVAVLDVARGAQCTLSSHTTTSDVTADPYAWFRPTPSYYSELVEAAKLRGASSENAPQAATAEASHHVFPVQVYSRYPVVRDRGPQEVSEAGVALPVEEWTNKSTLDALLRELAFKAGQLAKYGA